MYGLLNIRVKSSHKLVIHSFHIRVSLPWKRSQRKWSLLRPLRVLLPWKQSQRKWNLLLPPLVLPSLSGNLNDLIFQVSAIYF
jgi:hypothetical protein